MPCGQSVNLYKWSFASFLQKSGDESHSAFCGRKANIKRNIFPFQTGKRTSEAETEESEIVNHPVQNKPQWIISTVACSLLLLLRRNPSVVATSSHGHADSAESSILKELQQQLQLFCHN